MYDYIQDLNHYLPRLFSEEPSVPDTLFFTKEVCTGSQMVWYLLTSLRALRLPHKEQRA